jgi:hypothetical protein
MHRDPGSATNARRPDRLTGDGGVALVEFALVFPLLMVLLLGMVSAGLAYNQKLQITHAAREGARYGSTIPPEQLFANGQGWGTNVSQLVIDRSGKDLRTTGATVCVALVEGSAGSSTAPLRVYNNSGLFARNRTYNGSTWTDTGTTTPCLPNETYPVAASGSDTGRRVQVVLTRPGRIDALFLNIPLTLDANATAKSETNSS